MAEYPMLSIIVAGSILFSAIAIICAVILAVILIRNAIGQGRRKHKP